MKNLILIIFVFATVTLSAQSVKVGLQAELSRPLLTGHVQGNPKAHIDASYGKGFGIEFINTISDKFEFQYGVTSVREKYFAFDLDKDLDFISYNHNYIKIPFGLGLYDKRKYEDHYWKFNLSGALQIGNIIMDNSFSDNLKHIKALPDIKKTSYYTFLIAGELSFNHEIDNIGQLKYSLAMNISPFKTKEITNGGMDFKLTSRAWPAIGITYYPFSSHKVNKLRGCR